MYKQNKFETLNAALSSEGLIDKWPWSLNMDYDTVVGIVSEGVYITVTRFEDGRYERPIHYPSQMEDGLIMHKRASV